MGKECSQCHGIIPEGEDFCPVCTRDWAQKVISEDGKVKVPCKKCGAMILDATSNLTGGLCMSCKRSPSQFNIEILKRVLGDKSPLPIDEVNDVCKIIVEEEPLTFLTSNKLYSLTRKLRLPTKEILSHDLGLQALLVLFDHLGHTWLGVLGELVAEDETNVPKIVSLFRQTSSKDLMQSLFFVAHYVKSYHSKLFAKEFTNQLAYSWDSPGLLLILLLFDTDDTALLGPLNEYLAKLNSANVTPELRAIQRQLAGALKSAIRKIEGKPQKKWWQFWRQ